MTKQITSLIPDIYALFGSGHEPSQTDVDEFAKAMANHVREAFKKREHRGTLRGSNIGTRCDRKLHYDVNDPGSAEPFEPWVLLKFLYGHLLEELVLFLAQEAGHSVEKRQAEVTVEGIKGHIDAVVDGLVIDVKSASGYGIAKFRDHGLENDDPFGYLKQIDFYKEGLKDDPAVSIKGSVGFIAIDKSNGRLYLDTYRRTEDHSKSLLKRIREAVTMVASNRAPPRGYSDTPDGSSGNRKLCTECSYCSYKHKCWPGLRAFLYSSGPRWLTQVVREPDVKEITNAQAVVPGSN